MTTTETVDLKQMEADQKALRLAIINKQNAKLAYEAACDEYEATVKKNESYFRKRVGRPAANGNGSH